MRLFTYELKKLFSYRAFIFICAATLVMSIVSSVSDIMKRESHPGEYRQIYSDIQSMTTEEASEYITRHVDEAFSGSGTYSIEAICTVRDRYEQINGYPEFLDSIEERCKSITGISFFADEDSFSYKNAMKTRTAYNNVKITELPFEVSEGLEIALFADISDILLIFVIFAAAVFVFTKDKEIGILNLLHSYPKGRASLCRSKLEVLFVFSMAANLLFMTANLLIGALTYGLGDLSRPLQSVSGFFECSYNLSVWQYLIISLVYKSMGGFLWGVLFALICSFSGNNAQIYGISAVIAIAEVILYTKITTLSNYGLLHDLNLVSFIKPDNVFSTYRNIDFFSEPFNVAIVLPLAFVLLIAALTISVMAVFAGEKNREYKRLSLSRKKAKAQKIHGKMYYAFHKALVLQKSAYAIAVWLAAVLIFHLSFSKPADLVDLYYKEYTAASEGPVTSATDEVIRRNDEHFAEVNEKLMSSDLSIEELNELYQEKTRESAFNMFKSRCTAIRDSIYDTEIFYDSGYKRAFGVNGDEESKQMALLILIFSALVISPLISFDKGRGLTTVIFSTASGKRSYLKNSIIVAVTFSIFASAAVMLPYFFNIISKYGTPGISLPIQSLEAFAQYALPINVWQYALGLFLLRTILFTLCALAMLTVSYNSKSRFSATLINITVFVLPVLISVVSAANLS